jgi:hypothetical protein
MSRIIELLRGLDLPPWVASVIRGAIEATVLGGLAALAIFLTEIQIDGVPDYMAAIAIGLGLKVIRVAEGAADSIDPAKKRRPDA